MKIQKSFKVEQYELQSECNRYNSALKDEIHTYMLDSLITNLTAPSVIERMIYDAIGKPEWGCIRTTPGWKSFYDYAKLFEERYSIFPYTLFDTKNKNRYYIENIHALRRTVGASKLKTARLEQMDNYEIVTMIENIEDITTPNRRALNMCFPTELIGLTAFTSEVEKTLDDKPINIIKDGPQKLELPPSINAGREISLDELLEIVNDEIQL
ncbi:hypothetical protein [Pseudomonas juntendi]|uniref:hypothetical protein n=1 Tax=Pseudomonas juntendi TaxID=2666183 RepID=UPI0034535C93